MCGRYVQASAPDVLAGQFGVDEILLEDAPPPDYNVAPREAVLTVVQREPGRRTLEQMRWGLVPSWAEDPSLGDRMINARSESVRTAPAFQRAFRRRRCLMPADGFYEWQEVPRRRRKQPVFVRRRDGVPMAFAALWEVWRPGEDADWLVTCALVTTRANTLMAPVHDRMPVLLPARAWSDWLDREQDDLDALEALLVPAPDEELELWPVRTLVSDVRNNGPELIEPAPPEEQVTADDQGSLF